VWVSATSNNIPPEIFTFQRFPAVPDYNDGKEEDRFVHVCTYADMVAFPKDRPSVDNPYFRLHWLDLAHDSRVFLEDRWHVIKCHIEDLLADVVRINELAAAKFIECDADSSSSSSSAPSLDPSSSSGSSSSGP
jgi:hypothetical protein